MSFGALAGLKIIDLTQMLAGPYTTMMLADHGAEVIKIEPPRGDMTRPNGPYRTDDKQRTHGGYFQSVNRNKKSVVLDLKSEAGREAFLKLVASADVVVENFRPGVMDKLGLSYETLCTDNPKLVYGALSGFGDPKTGLSPYVDWPAFDVVAQAMGGIMAITGAKGGAPTKIGPGVGDIIPGMMLAFGILAALHSARETGQGQFIDVAMTDGVLAVCERMIYQHSVRGEVAVPQGDGHPFLCPFGQFPAADGYVTIAAPAQPHFNNLCQRLDAPELAEDPRFTSAEARSKNQAELTTLLDEVTRKFTKAELATRLGGHVPFGPVMQMDEIAADPHYAARAMIETIEQPGSSEPIQVAGVPVKMTQTPGGVHMRGPYLGEHTEAVLRAAGVSDAEIAKLTNPKQET